ncbi:hypothetical protein ACLESD_41185 [Pyxidicoccus sp. 3LFB2]
MAHAAWKWLFVAVGVGAGVLACSGDEDDGRDDPPGSGRNEVRPGLGDDPGEPQGTPFTLPPGVTVSGTVYGADDLSSECLTGVRGRVPDNGSGEYVQVCVPLRNSTGAPVQVVFPPGLVIVSATETFQHGLLVERVVVTVPPTGNGPGGPPDGGVDPEAEAVPLFTYCLNESKSPNERGTPYALGPVTNDAALQDLLGLLAGKRIDDEDEAEVVQDAIYSITEGEGLTSADRDALADL